MATMKGAGEQRAAVEGHALWVRTSPDTVSLLGCTQACDMVPIGTGEGSSGPRGGDLGIGKRREPSNIFQRG